MRRLVPMTRRRFLVTVAATVSAAFVAIGYQRRDSNVEANVEQVATGGGRPMRSVLYAIEGNDKPVADPVAEELADQWDIIICQKYQFKDQVRDLLDRHPKLAVASYFNATHTQKGPPYHPNNYYVRDENDVPVRSKAFPTNFLMNPRSGWLDFVISQIPSLVSDGYNAIYMDELGVGPIRTEGTTSQAVLPGTNYPWTEAAWQPEMTNLLAAVENATSVLVYANGLGNGVRYFAPDGAGTQYLLQHADRVLGESFLRGANMPGEPGKLFKASDVSWRRDIDMVMDAGPKGMFCSKIWSYPDDPEIQDRVERWATGSFLLGAYPKSGWFFSTEKAVTISEWRPMYDKMKRLGVPVSDATFTPSTGHRNFMNGFVEVDNDATDATISVVAP